MGSLGGFLFVYVLGGVTFIPLLLGLIFLHAFLTLPPPSVNEADDDRDQHQEQQQHHLQPPRQDDLLRSSDDAVNIKSGTDVLAEKFQRTHEGDVAAGYFAVCREYVPGGVNGKPPERTTPAGEVISAESPSVYQSMYRSIFDRKQFPTIEPSKGPNNNKNPRRARNVFYVVLRHGHLMLYDDAEQIEVRYVISLAHHDVSICGVRDNIPENELYIKRNAICLTRKSSIPISKAPPNSTLPFYLFSENLSEKEDFYFAIINNLETDSDSADPTPPAADHFDINHMVTLVRRLHSSEEHLQTRWINALIGRLFLALYKTEQLEEFLWTKISKKISRVQKPNFITQVALQKIDAGEGPPFVTNPRLKDLTVDGDCCVEADIDYSGNFRVQAAATARIDLGSRIKAREVDLVLAVVLKKLKGRVLLRVKPPPSNRLWVSFETMPTMEMAIEPIVSTRQITYGIILRAIENRIREIVAETLVQPFWDDIPFLDTSGQQFRGGLWQREPQLDRSTVIPDETEGPSPSPPQQDSTVQASPSALVGLRNKENDDSTPQTTPLEDAAAPSDHGLAKSSNSLPTDAVPSSSSAVDNKISSPDPIPTARARTFSHVADPVLTADPINVNHASLNGKSSNKKDATSEMIKISGRSQPTSPTSSPIGSPPTRLDTGQNKPPSQSESTPELSETLAVGRSRTQSSSTKTSSSPSTPASERSASMSHVSSDTAHKADRNNSFASKKPAADSRQAVNAIGTAAAAAKKWGMTVFNRNEQGPPKAAAERPAANLGQPMGRGRPLPPPGIPLPPPDKSSIGSKSSASKPKRKPVPPPPLPERPQPPQAGEGSRPVPRRPVPKPPSVSTNVEEPRINDDLMVVEAPQNSEPEDSAESETADSSSVLSMIQDDATSAGPAQGLENSPDIEKKLA